MRTEETLSAISHADGHICHELLKRYREAANAVKEIYSADVAAQRTPRDTVAACVYRIGYDMTISVLASLVCVKSHDGRLYRNVVDWATSQETAWDENGAYRIGIGWLCDAIHPAHLNQLAIEASKFKKPISSEVGSNLVAERIFLVDFVKAHASEITAADPENPGPAVLQLRALWTAFVLHNTLDPKMSAYDDELQLLWGWITSNEHPADSARLYSDFAHFRKDLSACLPC